MLADLIHADKAVSGGDFLTGWIPAALIAAVVPPEAEVVRWVVTIEGQDLPVITAILAAGGVLAARPLARSQEKTLPLWQFLLVTAIMLVVVELWVLNSQPGWLFAFVIGIGLGFSGYSLIELLGEEIKGLIKSAFDLARDRVRSLFGKSKDSTDA